MVWRTGGRKGEDPRGDCLCFTSCIQALARCLCLLSTYSVPDMKVLLMALFVLLGHKDGFVFTQPKRQGKRGVICSFQSSWGKNFNAILILTEVELWNAPHRLLCPQHFVPSLWHCFEGCGIFRRWGLDGKMAKGCSPALAESGEGVPHLPVDRAAPMPNCLSLDVQLSKITSPNQLSHR